MVEELPSLTVSQLRDRLRSANLKVSGLKSELVDRLENHVQSKHSVSIELVRRFLEEPEEFTKIRQANKLKDNLLLLKEKHSLSKQDVIERIFKIAEKRNKGSSKTLFLMNIGSSGSHWIEAMLEEVNQIVCINEVYFPKKFRDLIKNLPPIEKRYVMNVIHIAHSKELSEELATSIIVNSAHVKGTFFYKSIDENCICVLLARDPINIVKSRTYRKPEFRKFKSNSSSDEEYLQMNIEIVRRWFLRSLQDEFDLKCSYEAFQSDASTELKKILKLLDVEFSEELVKRVVINNDAKTIMSNVDSDKANLFKGERNKLPMQIEMKLKDELHELRVLMGYAEC